MSELTQIDAVVFDFGGVLIDWNPRHLYRSIFSTEDEVERFLTEVCTPEWNHLHDLGRTFADGIDELCRSHPHHDASIRAYWQRWDEMVSGDLPETVALVEELARSGLGVYGLTNASAEMFPRIRSRFEWSTLFDGILVSGEEGLGKPDPAIYLRLCERYTLMPARCLFVDDLEQNIAGARAAGMRAHHFFGAEALRAELIALGALPAQAAG